MGKMVKDTIHAKGIDIGIYTSDFQNEYISLTDIAKYKSDAPNDVIKNWMRNRDVIEFLGLWEQLHNADFKPLEFEGFKNEAGANAFTMSPKKWIEATNAILIKQGKTQAERMKMLHELAVQQMTTLSRLDASNLPSGEERIKHENFG